MLLERKLLRDNVEAQVGLACTRGTWEDQYLDFKRELETSPTALAKLLRLLLAFANSPRNRDAYIIYGVSEDAQQSGEHVGVDRFPSREQIEQLIREYTEIEAVVVDTEFMLAGKRTPYIVIPLQYHGPYCLKRSFSQAPKRISSTAVYMRSGSHIVIAGERERRKMEQWGTWFLDGRYVSSLPELEGLIRRTFPDLISVEQCDDYVRFAAFHTVVDKIGQQRRAVVDGHAYAGLQPLADKCVHRVQADADVTTHDRWLICHTLHDSARTLAEARAVRVLTIDDLFLGNDVYSRYCRAYLDSWRLEKATTRLGAVVDLDFMEAGHAARQNSILSWLESSLNRVEFAPTAIYGEFGTGKSVTLRQLVANVCDDYLRRSSPVRAVYVDLNSIDIRADRRSFVERALLRLPLSREDVDDLVRMVESNQINLVFDAIDEMARPYSVAGREEAFQLITENSNSLPCILSVRPNFFTNMEEMLHRIADLGAYDVATARRSFQAAELCELTQVQVEELLSAGLAEQDEVIDAKGLSGMLARGGLGSFLKDPLVLSLTIERIRSPGERTDVRQEAGKISLVTQLLMDIVNREWRKRRQHGGPLKDDRFHKVLNEIAYVMVRDDARPFRTSQIETFVREELTREEVTREPRVSEPLVREMVEQFRTQTWLHTDGDGYRFRHEVFTHVLAARHVIWHLRPERVGGVSDWNPVSVNAGTVIAAVREQLKPRDVVWAVGCLKEASAVARARALIIEVLNNLDLSTLARREPRWMDDSAIHAALGTAIGIAAAEPELAGVVLSCIRPLVDESRVAVRAALCFLASSRKSSAGGSVVLLGEIVRLMHDLSNMRDSNGHLRTFIDLLADARENPGDDRLLKAAGVSPRELCDRFTYEPLFGDLAARLPKNSPDFGTWRYVKAASEKLRSYVESKRGAQKRTSQRIPRRH